jgi:hypothetical protein
MGKTVNSPISRNKVRRLLGRAFDSRKTDEELTEMLHTIGHPVTVEKGPSAPEPACAARVTADSPAEERLAVLRAKQLAGQPVGEDEYEAIRQEVIDKSEPGVHVLWLYLERAYDCEVCELVGQDGGVFGFKIRTPKGTFLDWATRKELLRLLDKLDLRR